jgi:signal transduction histidine kinase
VTVDELEALRAEVAALRQDQTRAVSTKQELIETRDRLDAELRRYRQLADYTRRALPLQDLDAFSDFTAEALVEMFDLEFAALVLQGDEDPQPRVAGVCGPRVYRGRVLEEATLAVEDVALLSADHALCRGLELREAFVAPLAGGDARLRGVLVGGTREVKASLTAPLVAESVQPFGVVALEVDSLLRNLVAWKIIRAKNAELEASNHARTQFFANVSHEIRTPLNSIINVPAGLLEQFEREARARCGNGHLFALEAGEEVPRACPTCGEPLESLASKRFTGTDDELHALLDIATRNGRYLLALVNDILDASKLTAGRYRVTHERVVLEEVLDAAVSACSGGAKEGGVAVVVRGDRDLEVRGDPPRLIQILTNLLGNAVKFSPRGSTVEVEVVERGGAVTVSVRDHGPGIATEHHASILETFRQVPRSGHTHGTQGTGLGLAIARQLAEAHGGTIELVSALGTGSTFTLRLPLQGGDA